jgi:uncharacterized phiE125 gp8 family phage protein
MGLKVVSRDLAALPAGLLAQAKGHARIDSDADDALITSMIARAIAHHEDRLEVTINPTTVEWTPTANDFGELGADVPVRPVSEMTATAGDPPVDVSADYSIELKWPVGIHGVPILLLTGAATTLTLTLTCGYADQNALPPQLLDRVLRDTAHLYEHREILIPGKEYRAPDLETDGTWWTPKA